ncbi:MAG TPA: biosynthetic arginine decarboxylase [bacterium]|nr:biosynthetic arginine decarboxylase [bacterium]HMY35609.1 biosynthetic arginine decarboxylase [bacterium]HMZ03616.1 biosynthetic arginine decarboxylase [bacterium]HNB10423.1 biosynthetic arginine decarboxylase [bacterium]HNB56284.1 biosynthetic arginine decarboxylase [bacterium]
MTWTTDDANKIYNVEEWGAGYFHINAKGHISVTPTGDLGKSIDLKTVVDDIKARGIALPVLVRFQDILRSRVRELNEHFRRAISEYNYQGKYHGVFPIKVNQLREAVEEILDAGIPYGYGIECGSKPELYVALALVEDKETLIIANGYKDAQFIRMALLGKQLRKNVIIVVEKLSELRQILQISKEIGVEPAIGIRAKLSTKGTGKWEASSGDQSKFGLSMPEIVEAIEMLKENNLTSAFKLLHFHMGSQIPDIRTIKAAAKEASRIYASAYKMGMPIQFIDVGGGLGVDYDGSRTTFRSSMNYSLQEYANDIVYTILEVCNSEEIPHPNIVSESGRAIVAHHSVLVLEIFGNIEKKPSAFKMDFSPEDPDIIQEMLDLRHQLHKKNTNYLEVYHDAAQRREEAHSLFSLGYLTLIEKAKIENLYWEIINIIREYSRSLEVIPEELAELEPKLADQYLCNFSIFQSLLDHWAIDHLFPIVPIHRLNEEPTKRAILVDITCDSDGKICKFIDMKDVKDKLELHPLNDDPYYIGIFLLGAYQDIMGDMHNLFGRVNEVHVFMDDEEPDNYYVEEIIPGSNVGQVLSLVQYNENEIIKLIKKTVDQRIKEGQLKPSEGVKLLDTYEAGLKDYTYLQLNGRSR